MHWCENVSPTDRRALLRLVDATVNRVCEGLRVLEDYTRFIENNATHTRQFKEIRHAVRHALAPWHRELLEARDNEHDVGCHISTPTEVERTDLSETALANWKRVEEGLRSLEEYGKLLDAGVAHQAKQLRYRLYQTESHILAVTHERRRRLAQARLYVLVDGGRDVDDFRQRCHAIVTSGAHIVQLRDKRLTDRELFERAEVLRELTRGTATLFIVNDRTDLALAVDADGVHVGQTELPAAAVRRLVGRNRLVGLSTHDTQQLRQALVEQVDYVGCGPTFASSTKEFAELAGLTFLEEAARCPSLVAFAIGGITLTNITQVLQTGIRRVAVSAVIWNAPDPAQATRDFLHILSAFPLDTPHQPTCEPVA